MRNLASIQKIEWIKPIEGADRIELCGVLGWQCISKKGEFAVGDAAIYIEIDSIVPDISYFDFMKTRHYKVKTIKLRGEISQGLLIPINEETVKTFGLNISELDIGTDVTEQLKIKKREDYTEEELEDLADLQKRKQEETNIFIKFLSKFHLGRQFLRRFKISKKRRNGFPQWLPITDETRIQNNPRYYLSEQVLLKPLYSSEKLEGQSFSFWIQPTRKWFGLKKSFEFGIASRTTNKTNAITSNWYKVAKRFNLKNRMISFMKLYPEVFPAGFAIQAEIIGPKIQGNIYNLLDLDFYCFNLFDKALMKYRALNVIEWTCEELDIKVVPILDLSSENENKLKDLKTIEDFLNYANGQSFLFPTKREGVVIRDLENTVSFKVVSQEYLLEHGR